MPLSTCSTISSRPEIFRNAPSPAWLTKTMYTFRFVQHFADSWCTSVLLLPLRLIEDLTAVWQGLCKLGPQRTEGSRAVSLEHIMAISKYILKNCPKFAACLTLRLASSNINFKKFLDLALVVTHKAYVIHNHQWSHLSSFFTPNGIDVRWNCKFRGLETPDCRRCQPKSTQSNQISA